MKRKFIEPTIESTEYVVTARLGGSGERPAIGWHDSGAHSSCPVKVNSSSDGWTKPCTATNAPNSAGGSGTGSCIY